MGESKQVKVDNWGIFFLQRLQHFFNKNNYCDLTLQFNNNVQLKVHRLVLNACTEYFQVLEQTCTVSDNCLIMPANLQADVIMPIINFMYTGILEFHESIFDKLYAAAQLMNISVLTKLLDAQKVPIAPILKRRTPMSPVTWNLQGKKITAKTVDPDLPETLPGRKLPVWRRKFLQNSVTYPESPKLVDPLCTKYFKPKQDEQPKPTRFEWPDEEDGNFESYSFDEISYTSKPLVQPTREKSPKPSTSTFEEVKRSGAALKRTASPLGHQSKKVNMQDVKEYLKEQKLRSDYIDYDENEVQDNDFQSYNDDDSGDDDKTDMFDESEELVKTKRARTDSKEVKPSSSKPSPKQDSADMSNHTKIITEVLKKYPHLVKKNKNIRLKILAKGVSPNSVSPTAKSTGIQVKVAKSMNNKQGFVMVKPQGTAEVKIPMTGDKTTGPYLCSTCDADNPVQFDSYYAYRKHRTDVHQDKTDSQMCDLCGHVSRKQNMLFYHKYVKHNVPPPAMYTFPKCKDCSYIAPSPTILLKHKYNHAMSIQCLECNAAFPSKSTLHAHFQHSGHSNSSEKTKVCQYCDQKFASQDVLDKHIEMHERDIKTEDEEDTQSDKPKEKIKILSDIQVSTPIPTDNLNQVQSSNQKLNDISETSVLEPSSEAEALSNVASGIAASLGLVDTIVVLDENQFIIQQQDQGEENTQEEYIIPEMTGIEVQHEAEELQNNTIMKPLSKSGISTTDELVMVLTDHDYSDAATTEGLPTDNSNIVVLYSHPVQNQETQYYTQDGNIVIGSNLGMLEVDNNYTVANTMPAEKCEESIEMIQQELNNQMEEIHTEDIPKEDDKTENVIAEVETEIVTEQAEIGEDCRTQLELDAGIRDDLQPDTSLSEPPNNFSSEPMEIEESIELIEKEINKKTYENDGYEVMGMAEENAVVEAAPEINSSEVEATDVINEGDAMEVDVPQALINADEIQMNTDESQMIEINTDEPQINADEPQIIADEPQVNADEPQVNADEPQINADEPQVTVDEPLVNTDEPQVNTDEPQVNADEAPISADEPPINTDEAQINSTEEEEEEATKLIPDPEDYNLLSDSEDIKTRLVDESLESDIKADDTKLDGDAEKTVDKQIPLAKSKISNLLDDWDDGDTDSQQSDLPKPANDNSSINRLIDDWEDEEEA